MGSHERPDDIHAGRGQLLALKRAYERASLHPSDAGYFEAHGTGTAAGDQAELTALCEAVRNGRNGKSTAAIVGSVKANIGHTKAAAGIAGLLKTVMALKSQLIPPTSGCATPHPILLDHSELLRVQSETSQWPSNRHLIAGVSAMGFGGINTHLIVQNDLSTKSVFAKSVQVAGDSYQDAELLVFSERIAEDLRASLETILALAESLSLGELSDLSAYLIRSEKQERWRAAVVANSPEELCRKLRKLVGRLEEGATHQLLFDEGIFLSGESRELRLCLLFPGQGIPYRTDDLPFYKRIAGSTPLASPIDITAGAGETEKAQVGISLQCLKQLRILSALGVHADAAVGHSLGELVALHWAGAFTESQLLDLACLRGRLMQAASSRSSRGAMVAVMATAAQVTGFLTKDVVVAALNGSHIVLSGPEGQIGVVESQCHRSNIRTVRLPVQYAFHSLAFATAAQSFERELNQHRFGQISGNLFSTVTGTQLAAGTSLARHLARQLVNPVLFENAISHAARSCDLFLELGSDGVLADMVAAVSRLPVVSWTPSSVKGLLLLVAALHAAKATIELRPLADSRYCRKFSPADPADFLRSPCATSKSPGKPQQIRRAQAPSSSASASDVLPKTCAAVAVPRDNGDRRTNAVDTLMGIISKKVELPLERLSPSMNLLTDLHISSIAVAEIATEAARSLGKQPLLTPASAATKTIEQLAGVLAESAEANDAPESARIVHGIDSWVGIALVEPQSVPRPRVATNVVAPGSWTIVGASSPKAQALRNAVMDKLCGDGVLLMYDSTTSMDIVLRTAQEVCLKPRPFLVVCDAAAPPISGFIRSVALEGGLERTTLLKLDLEANGSAQRIIEESGNAAQFLEASLIDGQRFEPVLRFLAPKADKPNPFSPEDNLLVLGGGKGITAECAFELARKYGCSLALVGRSSPSPGSELSSNLTRLANFGIRFRYQRADVTDPTELSSAVHSIETDLGPITAVIHAAGLNEPKALATLTVAEIERTLQPKLEPLKVLEHCLDFHRLKAFVAFGSIIARIGFHGEAHYAHANELMREHMDQLSRIYKECRFLCLEWSVWSGLGMGEHLARVDALTRMGIVPLTPEMGTEALFRALETNIPASSAVITSRIPSVPTLKISRSDFKPYRFLERTLVDYPQIELIAEADLATQKDLYLNDHKLDGTPLFPAALGLEAMVEAATALLGKAPTTLSDVRFASPITVEEGIGTTIRVATLRRSYSVTDVTIRSSQTGFQVVHFRATCSIDPVGEPDVAGAAPPAGDLLRCEELYDSILFQRGRFRSVGGYFEARARSSCALLSPTEQPWFSQFLPQSLLLISPAIMDASMHSIQACIPHKRLIPTAIEQITIYQDSIPAQFFICKARERSGSGDDFHYDLEIADQYGNALQVWKGLTLHAIAVNDTALLRTPQLIANVLERRWREIAGDDSVAICLREEPSAIRSFRDGRSKRADGKPTPAGPVEARAWSDKVLLQVRSLQQGSCDLERVAYRDPQVWRGLLGESLFQTAVFLANERGEEFDLAATRVWGIAECLKKLGNGTAGAVTFETYTADGWAIVRCGDYLVGTVPITVSQSQTVAAFATRSTNTGIAPVEVRRAAVSL